MSDTQQQTVYVFINGILSWPGDSKAWTDRAVTYVNTQSEHKGEKLEYFSFALTRGLYAKGRAKMLVGLIHKYYGWRIVLVAHSNGATTICNALKMLDEPLVKEVHLLAAACEADFQKNGINESGVEKVRVYIGENDSALKWASLAPARWLGYGTLGKDGPKNIREGLDVKTITYEFEHSEWWYPEEFKATMYSILQ